MHEATIYNIRYSEGHLSQPTDGAAFEFPEPGYFSWLSNKEKFKVRLDSISFDSYQQWIFKLSDGKNSNGVAMQPIPRIDDVKKIIVFEEQVSNVGYRFVGI